MGQTRHAVNKLCKQIVWLLVSEIRVPGAHRRPYEGLQTHVHRLLLAFQQIGQKYLGDVFALLGGSWAISMESIIE